MIHPERIRTLNNRPKPSGRYVLYWMQQSQRARWNHALEYAVQQADESSLPLVVYFGITDDYPTANLRHYRFMVEGLAKTGIELRDRNIRTMLYNGRPADGVLKAARHAAMVVTDRGYTTPGRAWKTSAANKMDCPLLQVESDVIVPVQTASNKEEYAAHTLRRKIHRLMTDFMIPLESHTPKKSSLNLDLPFPDLPHDSDAILHKLAIDRGVPAAEAFSGGTDEAELRLERFIEQRLDKYDKDRNDPTLDATSRLSPYLHFGQASPLYIALKVRQAGGPGADAFLEELIVRRELAANFTFYNPKYDSIDCLPDWALNSLADHRNDPREARYSRRIFERAKTHDPYWNAAQTELLKTGRMHGYMRMYWGKKLLEWSGNPADAYRTAVFLNDKYQLDGRDPNGYAGVAWCFGKHDRPWSERPIFGRIRYMNANGLKRKFDAQAYVSMVEQIPWA